MMTKIQKRSFYLLFLLLIFTVSSVVAQSTVVTGVITDAADKRPVPSVTVIFKGTKIATKTDAQGKYRLSAQIASTHIEINYVGYKTQSVPVKAGQEQQINIVLQEDSQALNEVTVNSAKKAKYRNKDNPAVELIRQVIAHKSLNRLESDSTVEYQQYDWMQFSLSNLSEKFKNKKIFKNYQFLFDQQDSGAVGGKNILPVYLRERLSQYYYRKSPQKTKIITLADKHVNFDDGLVDNNAIGNYFERMYADVDIYANNIVFTNSQFLSPIADGAPAYYKFFITDTLKNQQPQLIELSFIPRLPNALLFEGKIYITMDSKYAVQQAFLKTGKDVNINFVRALEVKLNFEPDIRGKFHLVKSHLLMDFGLGNEKGRGFKGERSVTIKNYKTNIPRPDSVYSGESMVMAAGAENRDAAYWANNRLEPIGEDKLKIYGNIDTLGQMKSFKRMMDLVTFFFIGYKNLGPVEIGPLYSFYTFNNLEGFRLRFGGRTTTDFSTRFYFDTYAAYGFKDEKWKYFFSGAYSFNNKSIYKFPQSFVRASFRRDMSIPGEEAVNGIAEDNLASSFRRGVNDKFLYNDFYKVEYQQEYLNHFSFNVGFRKWTQSPAGNLLFARQTDLGTQNLAQLTSTEFNLRLRYAPFEKFYQGKVFRERIIEKYPVFELDYAAGVKGLFGGENAYHNLTASIDKRFYLGQFGRSDVRLEGNYLFGQVPFPLLRIHKANQSYSYQVYAYNLMNFLEFVSDHYVSLNVDHNFNGLILNRIPLLRSLKLREYVTFKGLYGGLRNENDPLMNSSLLQFPVNEDGIATTYHLGNRPYMEASAGLGNIFKVLRFDIVRRFNYLNHPDVSKWGLRAKVQFEF
ncbi:DUF5686 and carboxypeptidase-like regulatory domain-containing protein [Pedobacter antarcticus]|uniref:DUF5686 and carboxypeptidase-like regulatory domain-containing protein n=1 Tax=Pedobacter antarcticus TaxID=34086 RepID=UPI00292E0021|nr:DUF5686 family protein [Pedobacter antarcticus]